MKKIGLVLLAALFQFSLPARAQEFDIAKNDFAELFNKVRLGQPEATPWPGTFWPYNLDGTAAGVSNGWFVRRGSREGRSPMTTIDELRKRAGLQPAAVAWEKENHSCSQLSGEDKKSCEGWWGHCNGWAAAAIKEEEPRQNLRVNGVELTVSDTKGIMSEAWLDSDSLFEGDSDKSTETSTLLRKGSLEDPKSEVYQAFWDVTPRAFFKIFTNYVGLAKTGVVIDRFPGDQVWNQPIVGYRILPIGARSIRVESRGNRRLWAVPMRMKIYWANDLATPPGVVSTRFDIQKDTNDRPGVEANLPKGTNGEDIYEGHLVEFTLFFDSEVKVSADGKQVLSAGKIVGDGIWKMQENPRDYSADELNASHPDFIWLPTTPLVGRSAYSNPYLVDKIYKSISDANQGGVVRDGLAGAETVYKISFPMRDFDNLRSVSPESVRRKIQRVFARSGIRAVMTLADVEVMVRKVALIATFPDGQAAAEIESVLSDAGLTPTVSKTQ